MPENSSRRAGGGDGVGGGCTCCRTSCTLYKQVHNNLAGRCEFGGSALPSGADRLDGLDNGSSSGRGTNRLDFHALFLISNNPRFQKEMQKVKIK